jgi:hypothetical protein
MGFSRKVSKRRERIRRRMLTAIGAETDTTRWEEWGKVEWKYNYINGGKGRRGQEWVLRLLVARVEEL